MQRWIRNFGGRSNVLCFFLAASSVPAAAGADTSPAAVSVSQRGKRRFSDVGRRKGAAAPQYALDRASADAERQRARSDGYKKPHSRVRGWG